MFFVFDCIPDWYKTQEMRGKVVSEDPFLIVYYPDKYKTQRMCNKAVDDYLAALKLIPSCFVTSKMIKKLYNALYVDEYIFYFNEDSGNVVSSCNEMGILNIDLNNINLDNNFDEDYSDAIIHIRFLAWHIKCEKRKTFKRKIKEKLVPIA